jgi:hypothetical protein
VAKEPINTDENAGVQSLFKFIPYLENIDKMHAFGRDGDGKTENSETDSARSHYEPKFMEFIKACYDGGFPPQDDREEINRRKDEVNSGTELDTNERFEFKRYMFEQYISALNWSGSDINRKIKSADYKRLKAILTRAVTAENFCDGIWKILIIDDVFLNILLRLKELKEGAAPKTIDAKLIFSYARRGTFGYRGKPCGDFSIELYDDGTLVKKTYKMFEDRPSTAEERAIEASVVDEVKSAIEQKRTKLKKIPRNLNNRSRDGSFYHLNFTGKKITALNLGDGTLIYMGKKVTASELLGERALIYKNEGEHTDDFVKWLKTIRSGGIVYVLLHKILDILKAAGFEVFNGDNNAGKKSTDDR